MRILHAIHDFLPRHQAGSEIYAFELCRALARSHDVTVLCADFDPTRPHGHITWRVHGGVPVAEIVNNWICASFEDSYRSPAITRSCEHVLRAVQPDVVHVHNLLNLSFDLPALARARAVPVAATLHDYTLVCASGGQRIHKAESHVCDAIDSDRCARCFVQSPFHAQMSFGAVATAAHAPTTVRQTAMAFARRFPGITSLLIRAAAHTRTTVVTPADIEARLAAARAVFDDVDVFVAPSRSIAAEFIRFGVDASRIRVSDYGFTPLARRERTASQKLRIGFVGTLVWHKGIHVLIDAVRDLPPAAYELKIFGDPNVFPSYTQDLRARAAGRPIRFMGPFDRDRLADVYSTIDVLVVPSLWLENSPLVIHEAFMAGVPVVASRIGGIPDLVAHEINGLLCTPGSTSDLAAALRDLVANPERVEALACGVPPVKTIQDDVRELELLYAGLQQRMAPALRPA